MGIKVSQIALTEQIAAKAASWAGENKLTKVSPTDAVGIRSGEEES